MSVLESAAKHVLIVDDEEAVRYVFERYLSIVGYRISCAADGPEALDLYRRDPADAVITDFKMPGMNGDELLRRLRAITPDLPVVVISANPIDVGPLVEGAAFFQKPVPLDLVVAHLKTVLP